ncbi:HOOK family protein [Methylobacterium sp. WL18]|uniref:HOOK family protein n=1 Tax=Methylobacterium sp. WL18 TaxID=2603897 RepID=UPI001FEF97FE|nr:HOOK family protein [Methylobacterium sp. WL18]
MRQKAGSTTRGNARRPDREARRPGRRMAETLELDGLTELRAALIEERQTIAASVRKLRDARRQKGTFVLGDGAAAGPRLVDVQHQIDVVDSIIATLTKV